MGKYYEWFKALHIIFVISWMAGMFYMPRLFVYHTRAQIGSDMDKTFQIMERKLLRIIINPAMIASAVFGLLNAYIYGFAILGIWFHLKMVAVAGLFAFHGFLAYQRKVFERGENKYSEKFYRIINEVPTILMIICVIMVVLKPFE
ncbi:MAG: protoporphyrinogen oxidase HemJ [Rickettsiaceae bacterium]|nr:protoporphyrinogen oxidase HemJ [Rickettsiaceae bacterium]